MEPDAGLHSPTNARNWWWNGLFHRRTGCGSAAKKELGMILCSYRHIEAGDYCEEDVAKFDKEVMFKCWDAAARLSI
jgi:hypothetical protein